MHVSSTFCCKDYENAFTELYRKVNGYLWFPEEPNITCIFMTELWGMWTAKEAFEFLKIIDHELIELQSSQDEV